MLYESEQKKIETSKGAKPPSSLLSALIGLVMSVYAKICCLFFGHQDVTKRFRCISAGCYDEESWFNHTCSRCKKVWESET